MSDKRQRQRQREFRYHFIKDKEEPTQTQKGLSFLLSVKSSSLFSLSSFPLSRLSRLHFLFSFYTFLSVTLPSLPFYILFLSSPFSLSLPTLLSLPYTSTHKRKIPLLTSSFSFDKQSILHKQRRGSRSVPSHSSTLLYPQSLTQTIFRLHF